MASQHSPTKTPSRRALGELSPRAINSPSTQFKNAEPSEATRPRSPVKKVSSHIPSVFADKENLLAGNALPQGKKRGIEEVDDVERPGDAKMLARARDESLWESGMRLTADAMHQHTENNPVNLADPGSPTERNTPSPEPEVIQNSQKSNQSFSDFLNYELCASQKSEQALAESAPTSAPTQPPSTEKRSRADRLRTRLRFANYKVKTSQTTKRDVDVIASFQSSEALHASSSTAMTSSRESIQGVPNITISSPQPKFITASLDPFHPIGTLGQPPVQFAIPNDGSRISSRTIHGFNHDLSSSPPGAVLPQSVTPDQLMSPMKRSVNYISTLGEHDEVDIEEGAVAAHRRLQRLKDQSYYQASDRTNSVVKDDAAAVGLLELMSGRR
ncbi:hypothetical protein CC86DRAFT_295844 [Ophiobolus disseminans]|uniref:Uncharacterized protein n=1 Tax=Ophiobolus disseminans TaxID=1469910 RepID=A0A6A6ZWL0_9PLEO|nr:hypothetical protein CC86DRAFT_295844 [Ophiobolus disseminans]